MSINYEGTAIDTSIFEDVQTETEPTQTTEQSVVEPEDKTTGEEIIESSTPEKYNIEGVGEFTAEEIKEFRSGSLRQADYTRKTQELARQREELKEAETLYTYLRQNPHLIEAMKNAEQNPNSVVFNNSPSIERDMIKQIAYNQKAMETDFKLTNLHQKYGDFDESKLFEIASEMNTDNLEFVLKGMMYDSNSNENAVKIARERLKAEMEKNRDVVSTTVTQRGQKQEVRIPQLTEDEKRVAAQFGMSEEEYMKWR